MDELTGIRKISNNKDQLINRNVVPFYSDNKYLFRDILIKLLSAPKMELINLPLDKIIFVAKPPKCHIYVALKDTDNPLELYKRSRAASCCSDKSSS